MLAQRGLHFAALLPRGRENDDEGPHFSCANGEIAQSTKVGAASFYVRTGLQDEILKLKQEQGKNIMTGGVTLASQLAELGLIDEYHIVVHPIVVGGGTRLFEGINLQENLQLKLVESTVFKSGTVALRFLKG